MITASAVEVFKPVFNAWIKEILALKNNTSQSHGY